jgi:hypothetical protein
LLFLIIPFYRSLDLLLFYSKFYQHLDLDIERKAIDMNISWRETLIIKGFGGAKRVINSAPRDGTNPDLIDIGKTYNVIHFNNVRKDKPYWSTPIFIYFTAPIWIRSLWLSNI